MGYRKLETGELFERFLIDSRNIFSLAYAKIEVYKSGETKQEDWLREMKSLDSELATTVSSQTYLKGKHIVDGLATLGIKQESDLRRDFGSYNLFLEEEPHRMDGAECAFLGDQVDGSTNMERGVGNPSFVFVYAEKPDEITLDDIRFAFVKSYTTFDEYFACKGRGAWYVNGRNHRIESLKCYGPTELKDAVTYLRPGYGLARKQIVDGYPLFFAVKDIRAFDNTCAELCELTRGSAHFIGEFRGVSDTQNLLPYPILKEAGAVITSTYGLGIGDLRVDKTVPCDFIAASNMALVDEAVKLLTKYERSGLKEKISGVTDEVISLIAPKK